MARIRLFRLHSWLDVRPLRRSGTAHAGRGLALLVAWLALLGAPLCAQSGKPFIKELLASNDTNLQDEDGDFSDWLEIHNDSAFPLNLGGWHLSDDETDLTQWTFPSMVLAPDAYLVVFASSKDRALAGAELHTNFKLGSGGEFLGMTEPDGFTVAHSYAPEFPPQMADVSFGLDEINGTLAYFDPPTPGAPNGAGLQLVERVDFSHERGFHDGPFALSLSVPTAGASIYYTLDGSLPTEGLGTLYTAPLAVSETTIVRARAFMDGFGSVTETHTLLFDDDVLSQTHASALADGFPAAWIDKDGVDWAAANGGTHPGALYGLHPDILAMYTQQELRDMLRSVPSLSLVMAQDGWFSYVPPDGPFGLYVNSEEDWQPTISMEWIDPGGDSTQIDCGLEAQGSSSVGPQWRSQLSLKLKFKKVHGPSKFNFEVFDDGSAVESFDTLILDAGNQYSINGKAGDTTKVHAQELRDPFVSDLQLAMGGPSVHTRKVHVYLNGLYWGVYNLHERPDEDFGADYGGGEDVEYDWIKQGVVKEGNNDNLANPSPGAWKIVNDIRATGLAPGLNYGGQPAYDALSAIFDVSNYADYMLANYYSGTGDWPQNNWMATIHHRLSADFGDVNPDGKFVFHVWDAEVSLGWGAGVTSVGDGGDNTLVTSNGIVNVSSWITALADHPDFLMLIADRAQAHMSRFGPLWVDPDHEAPGTVYDPAFPDRNRPAALYQRLVDDAIGSVALEYARWGNYWINDNVFFFTPDDWHIEKDRLMNEFFPVRSGVLKARLRNAGYYPELDAPTFSRDGGGVPVGWGLTMDAPSGFIRYTVDGSDPRLSLGAVNPVAMTYDGPITLETPMDVLARAHDGSTWSALTRATFAVGTELVLNEFMADNESTVQDEWGEYDDWVEVFNAGSLPVDMGGMTLTDDLMDPTQWTVPNGVIAPAGGSVLLWADKDDEQGPMHMDFKLSSQGEALALFGSPAMGGGRVDAVIFGPQVADVSSAREIDGLGPWVVEPMPTPNAPNSPTVCQTDLGHHGPGSATLSVCGGDLSSGTSAELSIVGGLPFAFGWVAVGLDASPAPVFAGSLVPVPWLTLVPISFDGNGAFTQSPIDGGIGPLRVYVQAVYPDGAQPAGYAFSNAVAVDFLP